MTGPAGNNELCVPSTHPAAHFEGPGETELCLFSLGPSIPGGWGVGGWQLPYMGYIGMCRSWRVWFLSSLLWDRVYKSESLGLEKGIIFQETGEFVEDFV